MKATKTLAALLAVGMLLGIGSADAEATVVTFQEGAAGYAGTEDTTLIQDNAAKNYGGRNEILLGPVGNGRQRAGVIRFDVTSLAGQYETIDSMKLRFWVFRTAANSNYNLNLLREGNANWVEGTTNGAVQTGTATWNHRQEATVAWLGGQSGARLGTDVYGAMGTMSLSGATPVGTMVEVNLDPSALASNVDTLTEVVDLWTQNSGADNAGIQIYGGSGQWGVDSSESTTASARPELVVEYTIPEPATLALAAVGLLAWRRRRR